MMTSAVNVIAFRNLSLSCRNGTETVDRITQSPFITATSSSSTPIQRRQFAGCRTVTPCRSQQESAKSNTTTMRKRFRKGRYVRFSPEIIQESEHQFERPRAKKRRRFEASDSAHWYSRGELRDIRKSCITSIRTREDKDESLDRFQPQNQAKRKMVRAQAYETLRAVQAFEKATGTKTAPEFLSMLLQRYSMSRVIEANTKALRTAYACNRKWERH